MMNVSTGHRVDVHYTGKLDSGEVFDSSDGRDPLSFVVGRNSVIPGFEKAEMQGPVSIWRNRFRPRRFNFGTAQSQRDWYNFLPNSFPLVIECPCKTKAL